MVAEADVVGRGDDDLATVPPSSLWATAGAGRQLLLRRRLRPASRSAATTVGMLAPPTALVATSFPLKPAFKGRSDGGIYELRIRRIASGLGLVESQAAISCAAPAGAFRTASTTKSYGRFHASWRVACERAVPGKMPSAR